MIHVLYVETQLWCEDWYKGTKAGSKIQTVAKDT